MRRVVVTGVGAITPAGIEVNTLWEKIKNGQSGIGKIQRLQIHESPVNVAGEVQWSKIEEVLTELTSEERMKLGDNPINIYAYLATRDALKDAGYDSKKLPPMGLIIGNGQCYGDYEKLYPELMKNMDDNGQVAWSDLKNALGENYSHFLEEYNLDFSAVSLLCKMFPFTNPIINLFTACASSTNAIGEATRKIKSGKADRIVVGGVDSMINPDGLSVFIKLRTLSTYDGPPEKASRPFDATRDGFVLGEGAAMLVLEELDCALQRGAKIYAEVIGYGSMTDTYHITSPDPSGMPAAQAMKMALTDANIQPKDIGYINAHGTATVYNDLMETAAIKQTFEEYAQKVLISSTKSHIGHLISAAGAVELIISIIALCQQIVPPTINLENPDIACDLDYIPNTSRNANINTAMSNSFGFGGQNAVVIVKKYDADDRKVNIS